MRMNRILINYPSYGALINFVHCWTVKYDDKALSFFKVNHKVLIGVLHGNIKAIINTNENSIIFKLIFVRLSTGVGCTVHVIDMRWVVGGQTAVIIVDEKSVDLLTLIKRYLYYISRCRFHCGLPGIFTSISRGTIIWTFILPVTWWCNVCYQHKIKL